MGYRVEDKGGLEGQTGGQTFLSVVFVDVNEFFLKCSRDRSSVAEELNFPSLEGRGLRGGW